ncbi:MAG TPA: type II toxin-antitoxin system HipA family toxin [Synechococcus sp. UBA8638]|uniref:type II toxin-antitoxin system HipA family toxin n=1 Tax=Candidatus Synechococcus spongiarum TaxID=431041 RepID=UPI00046F07E4|nr:type II toxin-antitoxin system HipA family toxin [Candidatus Synechococcus spongiarum]HBP54165.1 type II toxin-antitoxin system HipA family toxin [Synechococcus sp. UBA8638]
MGRRRSHQSLQIFLNTRLVGELLRKANGAISFRYHPSWLAWEHSLPVSLSLPLQQEPHGDERATAFFENLLPDSRPIRQRIAQRVGARGADAYSLLREIGRDCVGALQFLPQGEEPGSRSAPTGEALSETDIEALVTALDGAPLGIGGDNDGDNDFRISVAGAQAKTALLHRDGRWWRPSGATPTTHLLKPQIGQWSRDVHLKNSVENEYLCLKLLEAFGLPVAQVEMTTFGTQKVLVVKRFDRRRTRDNRIIRLHQEDICQALACPPTRKYQSDGGPGIVAVMDRLRGSDEAAKDRMAFFKANVLFWLMGASDGHGKNFSLALLPGGRFHMTPLYDVLSVQPMVDTRELRLRDFKLAMSVGHSRHYRFKDVCPRHFVETGIKAGLSREGIAEIFDNIHSHGNCAIQAVVSGLPDDVPAALVESVTRAVGRRMQQLGASAEA